MNRCVCLLIVTFNILKLSAEKIEWPDTPQRRKP